MKKKRRLSTSWLQRSTLHYVQRYPATVQRVRQVMVRRIDRKLREHEGDRLALLGELEEFLEALQQRGHLDDLRQAALWLDAWHRKGLSQRAMRAKLAHKGLSSEAVSQAMDALLQQAAGDGCDLELEAAENYARRRRLGPYQREPGLRGERRQRDLAALARQGFSFDVAKRVIDREHSV